MNREIKFRGKRVDNGEWLIGYFIQWTVKYGPEFKEVKHSSIILSNGELDYGLDEVIPETIGQFTGLLDKNGKEIYEGDIVSAYKDLTEMYSRGSVENGTLEVWEEVVGNIDIPKEIVEYIGSSFRIGEYYLDTIEDCELEVIGNINDKKEIK